MIQIITDSSADLPIEVINRYRLHVVPLTVTIDGRQYREGVDISAEEFCRKMLAAKELPKTSQPSPAAFAEKFRQVASRGEMICLTLSSKLSGTYQAALLGQQLAGISLEIFDSQAASIALGLQVIKAAQLSEQGANVREIIDTLTRHRSEMAICILLNTLENIVKGGRLSKWQGSLANLLNIKVLCGNNAGMVEIREKIMGKRRALKRVVEIFGEKQRDYHQVIFGISHLNNQADSEMLREEITKVYHPQEVMITNAGSTIGTYAGQGGLIIGYC